MWMQVKRSQATFMHHIFPTNFKAMTSTTWFCAHLLSMCSFLLHICKVFFFFCYNMFILHLTSIAQCISCFIHIDCHNILWWGRGVASDLPLCTWIVNCWKHGRIGDFMYSVCWKCWSLFSWTPQRSWNIQC